MDVQLEEDYFKWLYGQVFDPNPSKRDITFWAITRQLHKKEFVWIVSRDDNRVEDGRELRYEFSHETRRQLTPDWHNFGVSMLEMLIALARRFAFLDDQTVSDSFYEFLINLDLDQFSDDNYGGNTESIVDNILDTVIWRTYSYNGEGGIFPLAHADKDQRKVEIWYQMNAYLIDHL